MMVTVSGLQNEQSSFFRTMAVIIALCCVLGQDTYIPQCLFPGVLLGGGTYDRTSFMLQKLDRTSFMLQKLE